MKGVEGDSERDREMYKRRKEIGSNRENRYFLL